MGRIGRMAERVAGSARLLRCVEPGRLEVSKGEARSADAERGNVFVVAREDGHRYYGTLDIGGARFRREPGLSGRPARPGTLGPDGMEFAVLKENVGPDVRGSHGFWAEWEVA